MAADKNMRRPTDAEYKQEALRVRLSYAPRVYACMKCGWPVMDGFCCNTCGDTNPSEPAASTMAADEMTDGVPGTVGGPDGR